MRCCLQLPRSLVQKLFRLRQVRRETFVGSNCDQDVQPLGSRVKRVSAKDSMKPGDTIYLPNTVHALPTEKTEYLCSEEELKFLHDLELYKVLKSPREVICTSKDGDRFWRMPECYIRAITIKYLRVPDENLQYCCHLWLGWLIRFIGHSVISGFTTASGFVIGLLQAKYLFGYDVSRSSQIIPLVKSIMEGADKFSSHGLRL
ncbi:hypothetical protein L1887_36085 [Cichorium endivia]|nr:hypothetical protein L1887_36085 [Cichorium endivia]